MTNIFWLAFLKGYATSAGLIIAIGAQNAFILRQGLLKSHVFLIAVVASIIDATMITLGVLGVGLVVTTHEYLMLITKYGGVLFLFFYGCRCFYRALFKSSSLEAEKSSGKLSIQITMSTLFAVSFLNPHMYLDTVFLIGAIGSGLDENLRVYYNIGAVFASTIWFFLLAYGARLLIPVFKKPIAWKILDAVIGIVMWYIAFSIYCS